MPAAKRKAAKGVRPKPLTVAEKRLASEQAVQPHPTARYLVETRDSLGPAHVTLQVNGTDHNMSPDERVTVTVHTRFPLKGLHQGGLVEAPDQRFVVRACELDYVADCLIAAIAEGRKTFVLPPKEDVNRTFQRMLQLREGPLVKRKTPAKEG
jgi:hypothetical protein